MNKEKDLLAEIKQQEAVIAEATARLKTLRGELFDLHRETMRNKKPTAAMLNVLAKLANGARVSARDSTRAHNYRYTLINPQENVGKRVIEGLRERECIWWRVVGDGKLIADITDHGRAVLAKYQKGGTQ